MHTTDFQNDHPLAVQFQAAIRDPAFPCVGAKSALSRGNMQFLVARDIRSAWDDLRVHAAIRRFVADYREDPTLFRSLILLFEDETPLDEAGFEGALWSRVQSLSDKDAWLGQPQDPRVSDDPQDPHFSLSFAGEGFFVVGLHPLASRPARRFPRRGAGVQPARSIRTTARCWAVREAARIDHRSRHRAGRIGEPHAGTPRQPVRSAPI